MSDKVVSLPSKKIEEGSNVRLKSGGPTMTIGSIKSVYICTFFDPNSSEYVEHNFYEHELEIDTRKVN